MVPLDEQQFQRHQPVVGRLSELVVTDIPLWAGVVQAGRRAADAGDLDQAQSA
jgi:hypothetical protein